MERIRTFILLFVMLIAAAPATAQMVASTQAPKTQGGTEADAKVVKKKSKKANMSPEQMTYVLGFVGEHHPELAGMLELLKNNQPVTFGKAMNRINASLGKLEALKARKPDRYPAALNRWKLSSRISVASAKLKHTDSEANLKDLEELLARQADAQIESLKLDRERLQTRMAQLNEQIAESESGKSDQIKQRIESVRAKNRKKKKPPTPKEE